MTPPPADEPFDDGQPTRRHAAAGAAAACTGTATDADDGGTSRINLRLPDAPQGPDRGGRRPRGPLGQRLARPGRRRRPRARRPRPPRRTAQPVGRAALHRLGALATAVRSRRSHRPSQRTPQRLRRHRHAHLRHPRADLRHDRRSSSATSGSPPATAPTPSSRCRPSDPSSEADVRAAEQTRVEYSRRPAAGQGAQAAAALSLVRPAGLGRRDDRAAGRLAASTATPSVADFRGEGRLGECRFKTATGDIRLDETGPLHLTTGAGSVTVDRAAGHAEVTSVRRGAHRRDRRRRGDQELQRRHLDRRGHRRPAGAAPPTATSPSTGRTPAIGAKTANGSIRIGEVVARLGRARDRRRRARGRHPRGHRRLARRAARSSAACTTRSTPPTAPGRPTRPSRSAPAPRTATSSSAVPDPAPDEPTHRSGARTMTCASSAPPAITRHRTAQVVRRQGRARRHRPGRRRGHDLRAARPQRRRQDHHRADPVHADHRRRRRGPGRRPRPGHATPTRSAPRSASPASSPRSTTCSPARRTCC